MVVDIVIPTMSTEVAAMKQVSLMLKAAEEGDVDEMEQMLTQGGDVNTADAWGNTPLFLASWKGHEELVRHLLARGAKADTPNSRGQTALHIACERGHSGVARVLVDNGASVEPDTDYLPPLHFAMFQCDGVLVDRLMEKGADINRGDASGATTLHRSCWCDCEKAVEMLLDRGANIDLKNQSGMTALEYAVVYGHCAVVDVFIRKFPDMIHARDNKGWTSLHRACADNYTTLVTCLLNNCVDIDLTTSYGSTPLHIALRRGSFETANLLLDRGARVDVRDNKGNTALHEAAVGLATNDDAQILVFQKLLNRGARVDMKNSNNDTPYGLCKRDNRYQVLVEHISKLRVAGLFVDLESVGVDSEMKTKCVLELEKMKETKFFENTSLKVVFTHVRNPNYLSKETLKLSLNRFLMSPRAKECFPLYNHIMRNLIQSSTRRLHLLTTVRDILSGDERNQWWIALPVLVQDYLLLYLDNDDLEKLQQISRSDRDH